LPLRHISNTDLVRLTPLRRYHAKKKYLAKYSLSKNFYHYQLARLTELKHYTLDDTYYLPLWCRLHRNFLVPCIKWTKTRQSRKAFQDASFRRTRFFWTLHFVAKTPTLSDCAPLWQTILYIARYCFPRVELPSHLSSKNLIFEQILIENTPYGKKPHCH
jgi:hypothetical protein